MDPGDTPYDLRWRMLGTDVRVSPWFWLMSVLLGYGTLQEGVPFLLVWIGCVFVSILVHEFGHVLMGRAFGTNGHIILYSFGGLAVGSSELNNRWQRIAVYLAGPGAGFVLFGLVVLGDILLGVAVHPDRVEGRTLIDAALGYLVFINLFWGILNLMPVYPLDGGQVSRDLLDWLVPGGQGVKIAFGLSMIVAGLLAVFAIYMRTMWNAILFGMLAFGSYQLMQSTPVRGKGYYEDDRQPWERDREPYDQDRRW